MPDNIVKFWPNLATVTDESGKKNDNLSCLALSALCISHGNASPERGFSVNKNVLEGRP